MKKLGIVLIILLSLQMNAQNLEGTWKGKCKFRDIKQLSNVTIYLKNPRYMIFQYEGFGIEKIGRYQTTFKFKFLFDPYNPITVIKRDDIYDVITKDFKGRNIQYDPEIVHCVCSHDLLLNFSFENDITDIGMCCEEAVIFWDIKKKGSFQFFVDN